MNFIVRAVFLARGLFPLFWPEKPAVKLQSAHFETLIFQRVFGSKKNKKHCKV